MVVMKSKLQEEGWWQRVNPDGSPVLSKDTALAKELLSLNVKTITDVFRFAADKFASQDCLGTRQLLIREIDSGGSKPMEKVELGSYEWLSHSKVYEISQAVGWELKRRGFGHQDRVGLFAETRAEWLIASAGALQHRVSVCTLYTNLSDAGVIHAINETEAPLIFTTYELLPRFTKIVAKCPCIKTVVVMEDQLEGIGSTTSVSDSVEIVPFQSFVKKGMVSVQGQLPVPKEDDTAIIMYTSGSTGTPKGVEISHANIMLFVLCHSDHVPIESTSRYLAFLPLAHIMELVTEISLMANGVKIFYSSPLTLTSSSLKILPGTEGDAKVAKPTHMNCVPLVLDRVIKSVTQKVEQQGWLKSFIFKKLVNYKFWIEYIPFTTSVIDYLIFRKVRIELGGELETLVVGGAPLSPQTQENFRAMFGCKLLVGYGSTETTACVSVMDSLDQRSGHTGAPNANVLLRLADWEEGGYRVTDKPNPRGEIVVGGPSVAKGYFKRPEETTAAFFEEDGQKWFRTGDIGEIDEYGCLKIIDRLKDLVKMKHGEYISLGNIESVLKTMPIVDNICVFADGFHEKPVAVIVPVPSLLLKLARENNGPECEDEEHMSHLYASHQVNHIILAQLQEHGRQCGLSKFEIPAAIHLTEDAWNPDSGLVTAALKLRRKQLAQRYGKQVQNLQMH